MLSKMLKTYDTIDNDWKDKTLKRGNAETKVKNLDFSTKSKKNKIFQQV